MLRRLMGSEMTRSKAIRVDQRLWHRGHWECTLPQYRVHSTQFHDIRKCKRLPSYNQRLERSMGPAASSWPCDEAAARACNFAMARFCSRSRCANAG